MVKLLAYGWSSLRSRPVASRPGRGRAGERALLRLGRADRRAAGLPRRLLGRRRRRGRGRRRRSSRRCGSGCSTCCRPAPAPSGAAIPAKGLTGPGYDGHTFWDTEGFVLPVLTYTQPKRRRRRRCAGGTRPCDLAKEHAAKLGLTRRGVPVADDPRSGVLRLLAGRHGGVPHQRRHRRRGRALSRRPPATTRSTSAGRARAARRDRAAVDVARPPRPRRRAGTSTASPGRTSTARSPTTTSSPT